MLGVSDGERRVRKARPVNTPTVLFWCRVARVLMTKYRFRFFVLSFVLFLCTTPSPPHVGVCSVMHFCVPENEQTIVVEYGHGIGPLCANVVGLPTSINICIYIESIYIFFSCTCSFSESSKHNNLLPGFAVGMIKYGVVVCCFFTALLIIS